MEFEWDNKKAASNLKKHGVSFREAASAFGDPLALTFDDPDHSIGEHRLLTFGATRTGKLVPERKPPISPQNRLPPNNPVK